MSVGSLKPAFNDSVQIYPDTLLSIKVHDST